ncbi:RNA polymerase sigma-70 factor [Paenibacillus sp. GCM10027627]|uniref:RNA polymerase sigma-70 factor n=1 Tax=unclassified Paenibacillus TaxID=185978 RepID=UPI0036380857
MFSTPIYETYKPFLLSLAYRLLGSFSDAEDIVQDVFADYFQLEDGSVAHEKAYLARMVTNRSLNTLGSARKRRETYVGNWLPEPTVAYGAAISGDPAAHLERNESVTYAMLVMLEQLSAIERAVFILRETFHFDYSDIASIVDKSEANCRKLASRAKEKLGTAPDTPPFRHAKADALAEAFIQAANTGDTESLIGMLKEDAVMVSDGGGKVRAAIFPIWGRDRITAFFQGLFRKGTLGSHYVPAIVSGQSGLLLMNEGLPIKVMTFEWDAKGEQIEKIYFVVNPEKLNHVTNDNPILS